MEFKFFYLPDHNDYLFGGMRGDTFSHHDEIVPVAESVKFGPNSKSFQILAGVKAVDSNHFASGSEILAISSVELVSDNKLSQSEIGGLITLVTK